MGFFIKQDHSLCFFSAKCSVPHHVITKSGSRQQRAEVKVQVSTMTLYTLRSLWSQLRSTQRWWWSPASSWSSRNHVQADTRAGIHLPKHRHLLSVQVLCTFLGLLKALQKGSCVQWMYLPSLAYVSDSSASLDVLLANLLPLAVLEQSNWTGEFQKVSYKVNDTLVSAGNKFQCIGHLKVLLC